MAALEAAYGTAWQHTGPAANLVLRRVLNLERQAGAGRHRGRHPGGGAPPPPGVSGRRADRQPLAGADGPWLEALFGFAQVDDAGHAAELLRADTPELPTAADWHRLHDRLTKLTRIR
ncbi:MAG: hypothetical protein U0871_19450 [Gemmataceae bacterium]